MTEEIKYIANLQRQEEFDNEVTELKDELKRLEQKNKELKETIQELNKSVQDCNIQRTKLYKALKEINNIAEPRFVNDLNEEADLCNLAMDRIQTKINEVLE